MDRTPAYIRIYENIKRQIMEGDYSIGDMLPPEPELEKRFNVSRTTIRKAMEILSREGFVVAKQGRGTRVLDYKTNQNLNLVTSISETLRKQGYEVKAKSMHIDRVPAKASIAKDLGIGVGTEVARIQRIQLADGKPIAIMRNYILSHIVPDIEKHVNNFDSLYKFLEESYNINIDSALDRISAKTADFNESEMLQVPIGSALLYTKRVCYEKGNPVCTDRLSIIGDRYEFEINMNGRFREE